MSLADDLKKLDTTASILTFDIETQRSIVETFSLWSNFTHMNRVLVPARILCFSARWRGQDKNIFKAAWDEQDYIVDPDQYEKMLRAIWDLLNEANIVVTFNGDRFDFQWVEAECARLGMGRPSPYKSLDLYKVLKRRFKAGLMSGKLEWSARTWLHDGKSDHGGRDLWHDIRHGTSAEKREARKLMTDYCIHDTELTERLLDEYLPWTNLNLGLYRADPDEELLRCSKCGGADHLERDGLYYTGAYAFPQYRCQRPVRKGRTCGGISRGKRATHSTGLRAVP